MATPPPRRNRHWTANSGLPAFHGLRSCSTLVTAASDEPEGALAVGCPRAAVRSLLSACSGARLVARPVSHGSPCWCCIMALISGAPVCVLVAGSASVAGARCTSGRTGPAAVMTVGRPKTPETWAVAVACLHTQTRPRTILAHIVSRSMLVQYGADTRRPLAHAHAPAHARRRRTIQTTSCRVPMQA